jgi:hypothetical protein
MFLKFFSKHAVHTEVIFRFFGLRRGGATSQAMAAMQTEFCCSHSSGMRALQW